RASLAPANLGRLLIDIGVHPDEMNAVLVGELLAQGGTVQESSVRSLRRELAAASGSLRDAAPAVALARLGLPITPLSLAIARQMQAGQLDPRAAWGELLDAMRQLARGGDAATQAGVLATELLADWRVPLEQGATGIGRWLRTAVDQMATPLEAKLTRPLAGDGSPNSAQTTASQDARARLDMLAQSLVLAGRGDRGTLAASLQRVQATVQAEQLLNGSAVSRPGAPGAPTERTDQREPRFFAVTLPTVLGQQLSSLELRVRERDARSAKPGEPARPDVVQLKLNLPGLGELGVNLTIGQHSVACHFSTSSQFAEALLTASSSELTGRLKRLGYGHTSVDAAHEPPQTDRPTPSATPRLHQVDVTA
ncbi:MAG: flagellar hook-length control protein FliK, partial [Chloroflexota bacterium]